MLVLTTITFLACICVFATILLSVVVYMDDTDDWKD